MKILYNISLLKGRDRPLGRPKCRWEGNVKTDLKQIGYEEVD